MFLHDTQALIYPLGVIPANVLGLGFTQLVTLIQPKDAPVEKMADYISSAILALKCDWLTPLRAGNWNQNLVRCLQILYSYADMFL